MVVRTSTLGRAVADSIRAMWDGWTPATRASSARVSPASSRIWRTCSPVSTPVRRTRRAVSRTTWVRDIVIEPSKRTALTGGLSRDREPDRSIERPAVEPPKRDCQATPTIGRSSCGPLRTRPRLLVAARHRGTTDDRARCLASTRRHVSMPRPGSDRQGRIRPTGMACGVQVSPGAAGCATIGG